MNEKTSRTLDIWIGIPLCWMLTLLLRLSRLLRGRRTTAAPRKIVFIKLAEMGAIVLTMPAFEAAARRVGRENLFCLMLAGNREIHDLLGFFRGENLITIRDRNLWTFAVDVLAFLKRCRREDIDCVIDLEGFSRISAILAGLSGAKVRVGLDRYTTEGLYRGDLLTHRVACNYYNHASAQFLTLVEALDAPAGQVPLLKRAIRLDKYRLPLFQPSAAEVADMRQLLASRCGAGAAGPLVILNCNLIDLLPLRRWPRERFLELGRRVLDLSPQATILLTGLKTERTASEALAREISPTQCFSLAGDTTLRSLVTLFTLADVLVTSDCGPGHMAALTDIPIVSIFGPETPQLYSPLTPHNHSLWSGLACSPCLHAFNHRSSPCRDNVCMREVTVDEVLRLTLQVCPALSRPAIESP
ncbi:MAG: glycosyltransferase family 9 protein [Pirellulales bacterium]|nr:glycosyltransferase family 9 protein [Pirellulales bacterium]